MNEDVSPEDKQKLINACRGLGYKTNKQVNKESRIMLGCFIVFVIALFISLNLYY